MQDCHTTLSTSQLTMLPMLTMTKYAQNTTPKRQRIAEENANRSNPKSVAEKHWPQKSKWVPHRTVIIAEEQKGDSTCYRLTGKDSGGFCLKASLALRMRNLERLVASRLYSTRWWIRRLTTTDSTWMKEHTLVNQMSHHNLQHLNEGIVTTIKNTAQTKHNTWTVYTTVNTFSKHISICESVTLPQQRVPGWHMMQHTFKQSQCHGICELTVTLPPEHLSDTHHDTFSKTQWIKRLTNTDYLNQCMTHFWKAHVSSVA